MDALVVDNLHYTYRGGANALKGLSFSIRQGDRVALLGPNGAGKSTLLLHFNGIYLPRRGSVTVLGQRLVEQERAWTRSMVGLVFQDPDDQVFSSTVWDDVAFGPVNMGLSREEVRNRVERSLEAVGISGLAGQVPYQLSFGQKKKVAIAGVLAMSPRIVVLDEPMAFLDPEGREKLFGILDCLDRGGKTVIIATHDVDLAAEWASRVIILDEGRVTAQGDAELLGDPDLMKRSRLSLPTVGRIFEKLQYRENGRLPLTVAGAVEAIKKMRS